MITARAATVEIGKGVESIGIQIDNGVESIGIQIDKGVESVGIQIEESYTVDMASQLLITN